MVLGKPKALSMLDKPELHSVCKESGNCRKDPVFPSSRTAKSGGSWEFRNLSSLVRLCLLKSVKSVNHL